MRRIAQGEGGDMSLQGWFLLLALPFVAPPFVGFGVNLVQSFIVFDKILVAQYRRHRGAWEADGKPSGFRWVPPGASKWSGGFAQTHVLHRWATDIPEWASGDAELRKLFGEFQRLMRRRWPWFIACAAGTSITGVVYGVIMLITGR
jgi:hypothetical protein